MTKPSPTLTLTLIAMISTIAGCVPAVSSAPEVAATRLCESAVECDWIAHDDREECISDNADAFGLFWTEDACPEGLDGREWRECLEAAETVDCDSLFFGWTEIARACGADQVCN